MSARATRARAGGGWDLPVIATLNGSHLAGGELCTHCLVAGCIHGLPNGLAGPVTWSHRCLGGPSRRSGP
jgi:hypothetical protein